MPSSKDQTPDSSRPWMVRGSSGQHCGAAANSGTRASHTGQTSSLASSARSEVCTKSAVGAHSDSAGWRVRRPPRLGPPRRVYLQRQRPRLLRQGLLGVTTARAKAGAAANVGLPSRERGRAQASRLPPMHARNPIRIASEGGVPLARARAQTLPSRGSVHLHRWLQADASLAPKFANAYPTQPRAVGEVSVWPSAKSRSISAANLPTPISGQSHRSGASASRTSILSASWEPSAALMSQWPLTGSGVSSCHSGGPPDRMRMSADPSRGRTDNWLV